MDVLIIVPSVSRRGGGVSEVVSLVNSALRGAAGVHTEVWAFSDVESDPVIQSYLPTKVRLFRSYSTTRFGFCPQMITALIARKPDIVYVHGLWMFHCLAVHIWSMVIGGKYAVTPHGMLEPWILGRSRYLKRLVSFIFQDVFLRRAEFIQALTDKEVQDVAAIAPKARCILVPNFVDIPTVDIALPVWLRPEMDGRQVFLYFGRIHEKKGCLELLDAWALACTKNDKFREQSVLVFAGWVDMLDGFERAVGELACRFGNVYFVGPQYSKKKIETIAAASFVVLPSHSEGLPMVVLEAWSMGKPVLMTAACNLPIGFARGAAFEIGTSAHQLAESLVLAASLSETARREVSDAAIKLASSDFSRATTTDLLLKALGGNK